MSTLLVLLACAIGCQGPISDWPKSSGGDETDGFSGGPVVPASPGAIAGGGAPGTTVTPPSGAGSAPQPTTPTSPVGTVGGTAAGGVFAGGTGGSIAGLMGGGAGGAAPDAGSATGAPRDAGTIGDASVPAIDAGMPLPDGGVPDGGGAGDAGDAGCAPATSDAGLCPSFGCRTREQLRAAAGAQGACSSEQALALACDGRVGKAALECTQESVFSISLEHSVSMCLKRDAAIAQLSSGCLDCYVDEALCTLSRCFAACTLTEGSDCRACRQQQCSAAFARCSGLPAPTF